MRMLDYKRYDVEVNEHYVWFEAPMRSKPSSNRLDRLYADLVTPMPGLGPEDLRVWRYVFPTQHTRPSPTRSTPGRWSRTESTAPRRVRLAGSSPDPRGPMAQPEANNLVLDEDIDLVDNVQQGLKTRDYACGPLSRREDAVAWFADRVRSDLAPVLGADA
jgi:Rieske 2Fe-2S family protein